jgi:membrane associated rhomboid family serine protease
MIKSFILPTVILILVWIGFALSDLGTDHYIINKFSLMPLDYSQFYGIITCNFLHIDYSHIYYNSIFLILLSLLYYQLPIQSKNLLYLSFIFIPTTILFFYPMPQTTIGLIGISCAVYAILGYLFFYSILYIFSDKENALIIFSIIIILFLSTILQVIQPMKLFSYGTLGHKVGFYYGCWICIIGLLRSELQEYNKARDEYKKFQ